MTKLERVLDKIRPALVRDGGDLRLVSYDKKNGVVTITLTGACATCQLADMTFKYLIEQEIKNQLPSVKEVRLVKS